MSSITQSKLAEKLDVSPQYISKLVKQGVLPLHDGLLDENECMAILSARDTNQANTSTQQDNKISQYYRKARAVKMTNEAEIARVELKSKKLKLESLEKLYVEKEVTLNDMILITDKLKHFINDLPSKLSTRCANKTTIEIIGIIESEIDDVMNSSSNWATTEKKNITEQNNISTSENESL